MTPDPSRDALGRFHLLRLVASDAWGTVHEASEPGLAQRLAVRILPPDVVSPGTDAHHRMRAIGLAAAGLRHPNIVAFHDSGWQGQAAYVATAFVEGETLAQYVARVGRLPPFQGLALATQLLSALEYAHGRGLVHGAIHPDHLLVSCSGQLLVDGFGWMAAVAASAPRQGASPAARPVDERTDVRAAAAVAYELLTGASLFPAGGTAAPAPTGAPAPVRVAHPGLPVALDAVFQRALAPDADARIGSAAELSAALREALGAPLWVRPTPPAPVRVQPSSPVVPAQPAPPAVLARPPRVEAARAPSPTPGPAPIVRRRAPASRRGHRLGLALAVACTAGVVWTASLMRDAPRPAASAPVAEARTATPVHSPQLQNMAAVPVRPVVAATPAPAPATTALASAPVAAPPPPARQVEARPAPEVAVAQAPRSTRRAAAGTPSQAPSRRPVQAPRDSVRLASARATAPAPPPTASAQSDLSCNESTAIAREFCTVMRCATSEFRRHPVCLRLHAEGGARKRLAESLGGR